MKNSKGAEAPFFLSICVPRLRDEALLLGAMESFKSGDIADALVAAECVCRSKPLNSIPALLRAKLVDGGAPALAASAWYAAWSLDPENPMVQDAMLSAWLQSGAVSSVAELGPTFLPARCRIGQHSSLIHILRQTLLPYVGACWKSGNFIEGRLFDLNSMAHQPTAPKLQLIVVDESSDTEFHCTVPANGECFRLALPGPPGVWSIAHVGGKEVSNDVRLLQGSPLVFNGGMTLSQPLALVTPPPIAERAEPAAGVDIVIPVYRDQAAVQACIASVLSSLPLNRVPTHLIVIDDQSPEPALSKWLVSLAQAGHITLLRNRHNLGFIESSNRGLRHNRLHDALLLNADTLVHGDWVDRLRNALYSADDIAAVMPWSNNAEIASFPQIGVSAPAPNEVQLAQLDSVAASLQSAAAAQYVEIPSCCGFAMLMRRSAISHIGVLDGAELTRGYLEEVDWCMRARAAGYRHLLATNVFVAHVGSASFRVEKNLRVHQNRRVVIARHPGYYPEYARFIQNDPIRAARQLFKQTLEEAGSSWLASTCVGDLARATCPRPVPAPMRSLFSRIAIWRHHTSGRGAPKVLALARILAGKPELKLRLLVLGEANEALWRTGVVDVLPTLAAKSKAPLSDSVMIGLAACKVLLTEDLHGAPIGIPHVMLDDLFDPRLWLVTWLKSHAPHSLLQIS